MKKKAHIEQSEKGLLNFIALIKQIEKQDKTAFDKNGFCLN